MDNLEQPEGEFHHFQLVNSEGEVPLSISLLVHLNPQALRQLATKHEPISAEEVIAFHDALKEFDGNFIKEFKNS